MKNSRKFPLNESFQSQALRWANQYKYCSFFNANNTQKYPFEPFMNFLAVGQSAAFTSKNRDDFQKLQKIIDETDSWLIGHLSYDLKNQIEKLESSHPLSVNFPLVTFFKPEHLIFFKANYVEIQSDEDPKDIYQSILSFVPVIAKSQNGTIEIKTSKKSYVNTVKKLIEHIVEGDIYEINYCIEHTIRGLKLNTVEYYEQLCKLAPTPFSVYYKHDNQFALGASPERFMKKVGQQLISQPIKGTARRGDSSTEDDQIIHALRHDEKELAENMMIVDLVRNDLAKSANAGSVKVEEMFGIYTFKHWHQMISTVSAQAKNGISISEIIKNAFPMGSMTGAPKIKVMELIEKYEDFRRGLYSGAIGYITPNKDFDFNVVIRTLFYDANKSQGSFMVGGAITHDSIPAKEYDECLLKAKPILETLDKL